MADAEGQYQLKENLTGELREFGKFLEIELG